MFVYDALTKMRSQIAKRKRQQQIKEALKYGLIGLVATALGFFVWLGLLICWTVSWA